MSRKDELLSLLGNRNNNELKARHLIDEICFLELRMEQLRDLPFIISNPNDPAKQKPTAAAKQYKEMLQQYNNSLRLLLRITGDLNEQEEESPLRKWLKEQTGGASDDLDTG